MESTGYLLRLRDPQNERALRLTLTEEGTALREQALAVPGAVMERLGLDLDDVTELHAFLTGLIERSRRPAR